ncbi:hypothetical protein [Texcoconibacillus texcoconensis]|uniref:Uncharacterized protein n=1 Tax=Texcoconibacillus texcoconensis TaxID=1095777 RepID=A0A840QQG0_9BACI|nr:hypothetical protein [Texcoconibacillus texcoconensis]
MNRDTLVQTLQDQKFDEVVELIEEAEAGDIEELELVDSLGLLRDETLNDAVINYLKEQGVEIIYISKEEE